MNVATMFSSAVIAVTVICISDGVAGGSSMLHFSGFISHSTAFLWSLADNEMDRSLHPANRLSLRYDVCLEAKRKDHQNHRVLCCVLYSLPDYLQDPTSFFGSFRRDLEHLLFSFC